MGGSRARVMCPTRVPRAACRGIPPHRWHAGPVSQPPRTPPSLDRERWRAFAVLLAGGFMTMLYVSIVNVALPSIESSLGTTATDIQWILAGYSLTFGLVLMPAGRLGDVFGRRRLFLIGAAGFVVASGVAGLAGSAAMLVIVRLIQGVFAGLMNPQVSALIQELFRGAERARAFGYFGMTIGVSTAIGPLLGGILVSALGPEFGWRAVFLINVPVGLVVVPLAAKFLPRPLAPPADAADVPAARRGLGLDGIGLIMMGTAVLTFMWPFVTGSSHPQGLAAAPWWMLAVAVVALAALVAWERRHHRSGHPVLLDPGLLRNTGFVMGTSLGAFYFAGFTGIFVVVTMYYQQGLGMAAWLAGLAQMPYALASAYAAARSGRRVVERGRRVVVQGLVLMLVAVVAIAAAAVLLPASLAQWAVPILMGIAGFGGGSVISPNQALALAEVPTRLAGTASGLLQTMQRLGASVGLALMSTAFFVRVQSAPAPTAAVYGHALALSLVVTVILLVVAIAIGVADMRRRQAPGGHPFQ